MRPTTHNAKAYSAASETSPLASTKIERRDPTEHDVQIEILFCGICHSDLHSVRNEWSEFMPTVYPIVPGHEIVGRVTKVGSAVTKLQAGRSRRGRLPGRFGPHVPPLQSRPWNVLSEHDRSPSTRRTSTSAASPTVAIPKASSSTNTSFCASRPISNLAGAAPLLCAGITTYSPMRHWGVTKGKKVGVVGLGGLGHMAREVRPCARGPRCRLHHLAQQEGRRASPRRRRSRHLPRCRRNAESTPAASISSSTASPLITTSTPTSTCSPSTAT